MEYQFISPGVFSELMMDVIRKHIILSRTMPDKKEIEEWDLDKWDYVNFINSVGLFNKTIKELNQKSIEYLDNIKI